MVRGEGAYGALWVNQGQRRFIDAPCYLLDRRQPRAGRDSQPAARPTRRIGLANMLIPRGTGFDIDLGDPRFAEALIRLKARDGLYVEDSARGRLPDDQSVPGQPSRLRRARRRALRGRGVLFSGGVPLARQTTNFEVVTRGLEQRIGLAAHAMPFTYGRRRWRWRC